MTPDLHAGAGMANAALLRRARKGQVVVSEPSQAVRPGDILAGKYRVERTLGAGGMGIVVAATHLDLGELRAIKFMLPAARDNAQAVARFLREARAAVRLRSEHVVKVHDVGRFDTGEPYMVMEYLEGLDLQRLLARHGTLPVETAVGYLIEALDAVAEAHSLGIVHRDLKPANLFVTLDRDGQPCVKVVDFGISKMHAAGERMDLTTTATLLGSPYYMSPEQMRDSKDVDARSDIWSLGVILFELLCGKRPFAGETVTALCGAVIQDEPAPLSQLNPAVPEGLARVVARCLAKRREERFASAGELAAALAPYGPATLREKAERIAHLRPSSPPVPPLGSGEQPRPTSEPGVSSPSFLAQPGAASAPSFGASPAPEPVPSSNGELGAAPGATEAGMPRSSAEPVLPTLASTSNTSASWGGTQAIARTRGAGARVAVVLGVVLVAAVVASATVLVVYTTRTPTGAQAPAPCATDERPQRAPSPSAAAALPSGADLAGAGPGADGATDTPPTVPRAGSSASASTTGAPSAAASSASSAASSASTAPSAVTQPSPSRTTPAASSHGAPVPVWRDPFGTGRE